MSEDFLFDDAPIPGLGGLETDFDTPPAESKYPFPCDVDGCDSGGKTERGLKSHKTRAHGLKSDHPPKGSSTKSTSLEKKLTQLLGTLALGLSVVDHDGFCAPHVMNNAETVAKAWDHLAQDNKTVKRVLESILTTSAFAEVLMATAVLVLPIAAQHGALPASLKMVAMMGSVKVPDSAEGLDS